VKRIDGGGDVRGVVKKFNRQKGKTVRWNSSEQTDKGAQNIGVEKEQRKKTPRLGKREKATNFSARNKKLLEPARAHRKGWEFSGKEGPRRKKKSCFKRFWRSAGKGHRGNH